MIHKIPSHFLSLANHLQKHGINLFLVGGWVRDSLVGIDSNDFDACIDSPPDELLNVCESHFKCFPTGIKHGTVTVIVEKTPIEVTSFRKESKHTGRHAEVIWTKSMYEDAIRRDFTINSIYIDKYGKVYDPTKLGLNDLKESKVNFIGNAEERIKEDYLRIFRYFRFKIKFEHAKTINSEIKNIIKRNSEGIKKISVERIIQEIIKILSMKNNYWILKEMDDSGVLNEINLKTPTIPFYLCNKLSVNGMLACISKNENIQNSKLHKKLSKNSRMHIKNLNSFMKSLRKDQIYRNLFNENTDLAKDMIEIYRFFKNDHIIIPNKIPKFPVESSELIKLGFSGKELGEKINQLKDKWLSKGFKF